MRLIQDARKEREQQGLREREREKRLLIGIKVLGDETR
jgi:hypothetical protein